MFAFLPLLAEANTRVFLEWARIGSKADLVVSLAVVAALSAFAWYMIRLDTRELSRPVRWALAALRIGAILCLWVIFLGPEWRSEREVVRNSRVLLLVDTSSSMGLTDVDSSSGPAGTSRVGQVAAALDETDFLAHLRKTHDVVVFRFDEDLRRLVSLEKLAPGLTQKPLTPNPSPRKRGEGSWSAHDTIDWQSALAPTGSQTRLGQALNELVLQERGSPVSGIVVFSDGGQNAGISPDAALQEATLPVFAVGVGSQRHAVNVRVYKLEVPPRAYPGDPYSVTGLIQAQGMAGESVTAELLVRPGGTGIMPVPSGRGAAELAEAGSGVPVRREEVVLAGDGEVVPVKFELTPGETGRQTICLRVRAPEADSDPGDDYQEEEIAIVDRKTRVLLFAGGPTREYRFLRTQLYRDSSTTVDVLLGTAQPGVSQEADSILDHFPATPEEMFAYDCVVAFDPDWQTLTQAQVDLLERWVGEQGGGLLVIPGPVYAGESVGGWVQDPALAKIRDLYPVEFQRRLTVFDGGTYVSNEPWPLEFTREGLEAEFLWLDDTAAASSRAWAEFPGVYSYFPTRGPKPGATVLAVFSDPAAAPRGTGVTPVAPGVTPVPPGEALAADRQPVYFAEQFYGSGCVFYIGSGEMWRLRRAGEGRFERLYTRLIRHVSQGRLLRQSSRGALLVGQDRYVLGSAVAIRAQLTNPRFEPLEAPGIALDVIAPAGSVQTLTLRPDPSRAGVFTGQLTVLNEGTYRLELAVPGSDDERLTRNIKVSLPDLERQDPRRNDKVLGRLAQATGGKYYLGLDSALNPEGPDPLLGRLKDRTRTIIHVESSDPPSILRLVRQFMTRAPAEHPSVLWLAKSLVNDKVYPWLSRQGWFTWLVEESWLRWLLERTVSWWLMILLCGLLCSEWLVRRLSRLA